MRNIRILAVCVLAAVGAVAGCSSSPTQRGTGEVVSDSALTARVKTAIARDTTIGNAMNVNVNTYRGVVQLAGFVESEEAARRAAEVARNVQGVQSVKNDLQINPPKR
jgi:hyperosmotically inducible periplasmic protein